MKTIASLLALFPLVVLAASDPGRSSPQTGVSRANPDTGILVTTYHDLGASPTVVVKAGTPQAEAVQWLAEAKVLGDIETGAVESRLLSFIAANQAKGLLGVTNVRRADAFATVLRGELPEMPGPLLHLESGFADIWLHSAPAESSQWLKAANAATTAADLEALVAQNRAHGLIGAANTMSSTMPGSTNPSSIRVEVGWRVRSR